MADDELPMLEARLAELAGVLVGGALRKQLCSLFDPEVGDRRPPVALGLRTGDAAVSMTMRRPSSLPQLKHDRDRVGEPRRRPRGLRRDVGDRGQLKHDPEPRRRAAR